MNAIRLLLLSFTLLHANTIIYNANIYTVDDTKPHAQAIVVEHSKIAYVGDNETALHYKNSGSVLLDAQGKFIMPGIIDAHTHVAIAALMFNMGVNLVGTKGSKEIIERLKAYKKANPHLEIYSGFGFYPYAFGPEGPNKAVLDEIFPHSQAFFISNNGHQAWANSKTLEYLHITKNTPDPLKNIHYYCRDKEGNPTGFLVEGEAFWPHLKSLGLGKKAEFKASLESFLPRLSALGITTLYDAAIPAVETAAFAALKELEQEKRLPLRYRAAHCILNKQDARTAVKELRKEQGHYNGMLFQVNSIKFINDNSDDDNFGIQFAQEELSGYLDDIIAEGEDVMIHTSQDSAAHQALNAIQSARKKSPDSKSRITLAHVNMIRESDFERFKSLGVIANIQPFDAQGGAYYEYRYMLFDEVWENRLARYKHFFDTGVLVSASSDYPSCNKPLNECTPFDGVQIAMTRQKIDARGEQAVLASKEERLSLAESIKAYTINGAYQLHMEEDIGSLSEGKEADLIILDKDPFQMDMHDIHTVKVIRTIVQGKTVFQR